MKTFDQKLCEHHESTRPRLYGRDAIRYIRCRGKGPVGLRKFADPTEDALDLISFEKAGEVCSEDPGLIWCYC